MRYIHLQGKPRLIRCVFLFLLSLQEKACTHMPGLVSITNRILLTGHLKSNPLLCNPDHSSRTLEAFTFSDSPSLATGNPVFTRPHFSFCNNHRFATIPFTSINNSNKMDSEASYFDLFVIGAGSGGIACARRAASYGKRVGIAESNRLGGTCVNVGCVPKKVMWNAANIMQIMREANHYGIHMGDAQPKLDWAKLKLHRDNYVKRLNDIYEKNLENSNVILYEGFCSFSGKNELTIINEKTQKKTAVSAKHILIASGSAPAKLNIPGEEHTINSDGFFDLANQPKRVAVIGAGYIAVEFTGIFNELGSETHLFVRGSTALRKFDEMLAKSLDEDMRKHHVQMHPDSIPTAVTKDKDTSKLSLVLANGEVHNDFDCILVATGRCPATKDIGTEIAEVETNPIDREAIVADEFQNTSSENLHALGDVCGKVELTPMAIAAGRRLADRLFGKIAAAKADYTNVPTVIFTHPPIATVGLTEAEARAKYGDDRIKIYTNSAVNLYYGPFQLPPAEKPKTKMKLVCLKDDDKIVGAHVYGMGADEMIQGFGVAIKMGACKSDFDNCVAVHPTAAEEFVTMHPWGLREEPKKNDV